MEVLLDANFFITSLKEKIDFIRRASEDFDENFEWVVPEEVVEELKIISKKKGEKIKTRQLAVISLEIIRKNKIKVILLGNKITDNGIIVYLKKHPKTILATLDNALKKRISNRILTIRNKKKLVIN